MRQTQGHQRFLHETADCRHRCACVLQSKSDLTFYRGHNGLTLGVLEHQTHHASQITGAGGAGVLAVDEDATGKCSPVEVGHQPVQRPQHRGLATAGTAEEEYHFSRLQGEAHVPHVGAGFWGGARVAVAEMFYRDEGRHCRLQREGMSVRRTRPMPVGARKPSSGLAMTGK